MIERAPSDSLDAVRARLYGGYGDYKSYGANSDQRERNARSLVGNLVRLSPAFMEARRVLEIGCGTGELAVAIGRALPSAEVIAVDADSTAVGIARGLGVDARVLDVTSAWPDLGVFDVVLAVDVLEHLTLPEAFRLLAQCARCLRPGGVVLLRVPNNAVAMGVNYQLGDLTHCVAYNQRSAAQLFLAAGFVDVAALAEVSLPPNRLATIRRAAAGAMALWFRLRDTVLYGARDWVYSPNLLLRARRP